MVSLATLDPRQSAATLEKKAAPFNAFSDATVWQPGAQPQIVIKALPTMLRSDGYLELSDAAGISIEARQRLERALARINDLLGSPGTSDLAEIDSRVLAESLRVLAAVIASLEIPTEVFPLADGGLSFRWRTAQGAVEAEFDSEGDAVVLLDDTASGERRAGYFAELWPAALRWLQHN